MSNDGYGLINGKLISGSVLTDTTDVEVSRITIPENVDTRITTLCVIQDQGSATDGYSYWIDGLVSRTDGYASFINDGYVDGYGCAYNTTGTETDVTIVMKPDGNNVVLTALQGGSATCRLATFSEIYQVSNVGIETPAGPPLSNLSWWHESDDVVLNSPTQITSVNDKSGNGFHRVFQFLTTPFAAAGGPNGLPWWGTVNTGNVLTGYGSGITDLTAAETHYYVVWNRSATTAYDGQCSGATFRIYTGSATYGAGGSFVYDGAVRAQLTSTGSAWQILRVRWTAALSAIKYTGQTEATGATPTIAGRWWSGGDKSQFDQALHLRYTEDTLASGADVDIQAWLLSKYGLSL